MKKIITIVDYGSGNLLSAQQSFIKVVNLIGADAEIQISNNPENLKFSSHVVLPGQGAFKTCMDGIKKITGMEEQLNEFVKVKQRPFFGICVGMQLLAENSQENGNHQGLGWIEGTIKKSETNAIKKLGKKILKNLPGQKITSEELTEQAKDGSYFIFGFSCLKFESFHYILIKKSKQKENFLFMDPQNGKTYCIPLNLTLKILFKKVPIDFGYNIMI